MTMEPRKDDPYDLADALLDLVAGGGVGMPPQDPPRG